MNLTLLHDINSSVSVKLYQGCKLNRKQTGRVDGGSRKRLPPDAQIPFVL